MESIMPVMAYNAPKNKIDTAAKRTAMAKPHLERHDKIFRQMENENVTHQGSVEFVL